MSTAQPTEDLDYVPFPVEVLPDPAQSYVAAGAAAIDCDASYLALPMLAAVASAVGNSRRIELKSTWAEPPIIGGLVVCESGSRKSSAQDLVVQPVHDREEAALLSYTSHQQVYRTAKASHDHALRRWNESGEGEMPQPPPEPLLQRCIVTDTTVEALADRLKDSPRGLLVAPDEFAAVLAGMNQYKGRGNDASHWIELFGGRPWYVDRKGSKMPIFIPRATASVFGGIQPGTLRRLLLTQEHLASGMAARFLFALPDQRKKVWSEATVSAACKSDYWSMFDRLYSMPGVADAATMEPVIVPLTAAGKAAFIRFHDDHANKQFAEKVEAMKAALSKLEAYAT